MIKKINNLSEELAEKKPVQNACNDRLVEDPGERLLNKIYHAAVHGWPKKEEDVLTGSVRK